MRYAISRGSVLAAVLACLSGCGGDRPFTVRGHLVYEDDGQPVKELAGSSVTFTSEELHKSATGNIDQDGNFQLGSLTQNDGAFPGKYKVSLAQPHPKPERGQFAKPVVDLSYEDPNKSNLEAIVEANNKNEFTFKLKRIAK
jgi:hypothetical protein